MSRAPFSLATQVTLEDFVRFATRNLVFGLAHEHRAFPLRKALDAKTIASIPVWIADEAMTQIALQRPDLLGELSAEIRTDVEQMAAAELAAEDGGGQ